MRKNRDFRFVIYIGTSFGGIKIIKKEKMKERKREREITSPKEFGVCHCDLCALRDKEQFFHPFKEINFRNENKKIKRIEKR